MKKLTKKQVTILNKVKEKITQHPEKFIMDAFHSECNTMHCISGWMSVIRFKKKDFKIRAYESIFNDDSWTNWVPKNKKANSDNALNEKYLGYNSQGDCPIFYLPRWSKPFRKSWKNAKTAKGKAKIACAVIDDFIKQRGVE